MENKDFTPDLLKPFDDGACDHLTGMKMPNITLHSTSDNEVNLSQLKGMWVLYLYPKTATPHTVSPKEWLEIEGARGCTPQSCAFRDNYESFNDFNTKVYGISTQSTSYQQEVVQRLNLPFEVLSDINLELVNALSLPTFIFEDRILLKRVTLVVKDGIIIKVFYPVYPPEQNALEVLTWLEEHKG